MNSPLRILLIAHSFPPSAEVGRTRAVGLCTYLPEFGIQPAVLTVHNRAHKQLDYTRAVPAGIRVIRTAQHDTPLDWYSNWKSRRIPADSRKNTGSPKASTSDPASDRSWRQVLLSVLSFPNQYWGWYFPARQTGRHLLQSGEFDAILSTSPPYTAHLIALSLKTKYQIPWIADFRDPWAANDPLLSLQPKWRQALDARMEASCVTAADLVVCNTDRQRDDMHERYPKLPREKFVTLTNGFDDVEPLPNLSLNEHKPQLCLHLGGIYEGRRIDTFCSGLSILVKERRLDPQAVKILFLGDTEESQIAACRKVAGELMDSGMIEFHPQVDWEEGRRFLWQADLLLVFQGGYRKQIPLKFYEYLVTGKPIFAVTELGALSDMIDATGAGMWARQDEPREIAEKFLEVLALPAQTPEAAQRRWGERFHFRSLCRQLAIWIRELVEARKHVSNDAIP